MKKALIVAALLCLIASDANAVVYCAAGVYRAGCVWRPGYGVGVRRYPYVGARPYARHYGVRRY
jgi:hypothetical protein